MEQGKIRSSGGIGERPKSKPIQAALKLSFVSCQLSGKREEGRGNREQGTGNREQGRGKLSGVRSQESGVRSQESGVRSQESGVSYPLSGKNDARKNGDRTQENPSIWRKIMQIYG